jgi:hypothetical protein
VSYEFNEKIFTFFVSSFSDDFCMFSGIGLHWSRLERRRRWIASCWSGWVFCHLVCLDLVSNQEGDNQCTQVCGHEPCSAAYSQKVIGFVASLAAGLLVGLIVQKFRLVSALWELGKVCQDGISRFKLAGSDADRQAALLGLGKSMIFSSVRCLSISLIGFALVLGDLFWFGASAVYLHSLVLTLGSVLGYWMAASLRLNT